MYYFLQLVCLYAEDDEFQIPFKTVLIARSLYRLLLIRNQPEQRE